MLTDCHGGCKHCFAMCSFLPPPLTPGHIHTLTYILIGCIHTHPKHRSPRSVSSSWMTRTASSCGTSRAPSVRVSVVDVILGAVWGGGTGELLSREGRRNRERKGVAQHKCSKPSRRVPVPSASLLPDCTGAGDILTLLESEREARRLR